MNAERLLTHYERIADAPDAIARLRRFILDLAVRGKLVAQEAGDEPASELLKRIAQEKARLTKSTKPALSDMSHNPLFRIPDGWAWTTLGGVSTVTMGQSPPGETYNTTGEGVPLINGPVEFTKGPFGRTVVNQFTTAPTNFCEKGDLLICVRGSTTGRTNVAAFRACIGRGVAAIRSSFDDSFVRLFIWKARYDIIEMGRGVAFPSVSKKQIEDLLFALPPLAEQHRIVAKVDELMALCDQLEATRGKREAGRDRLAAVSLAGLNESDPATFHSNARFALSALSALTTRPDQIKQLRQAIFNLAIRGKLVEQNPNDEPASELLLKIAEEKTRFVKEGKAKRQNLLRPVEIDQTPFSLPAAWVWVRFPEVGTFGRGKSKHRPRNDPALFDGGKHLMIQTGDVARSQGVIKTYTSKYNDFGLSQSFKWPEGTLCITIAANIADSGILGFEACFPDSVVGFIPASMFENARYFEYFVRTAKANLLEFAPATAQKNINLEILTQVLIPLPPLAEQHRIVAKVDALMALCDQLEASLAATTTTRRRLLDALLAEALEPTEAREMKAAE